MKKLFAQLLFATAITTSITFTTQAMQSPAQKPVYTFDHDDVINVKNKLGITDYARYVCIIGKIGWHNPLAAAGLLWNWRTIKSRGEEIAKDKEGTSNIIYALAQELKKEGYADLTPYVEEMTAITVKPTPIWETINYIKELKKQGYTVIGATNQDYYQNKYFRERMETQGVHFGELFDAVLIAHTTLKAQELPKHDNVLIHELEKGIFMPTSVSGTKPHKDYFYALKELAQRHAQKASTFIHTDDKLENIQGAQSAGFKAAHFELPEGKSARRCTLEELETTISEWKKNIEKLG